MNSNQLLEIAEKLAALADSIRSACNETTEKPKSNKPTVTLEQVRCVLADKSKDGLIDEVKTLIRKYGADRLSEISPDYFPDMLKEAEGLGHA